MTVGRIIKEAEKINEKYFNNEVEVDVIEFKTNNRLTSTLGRYCPKTRQGNQRIDFCPAIFEDEGIFNTVMVHELIHAWTYQKGYGVDHGPIFKIKAMEINTKHGLNIARKISVQNTKVEEVLKQKKASQNRNLRLYVIKLKFRNEEKIWFMKNLSKEKRELIRKFDMEVKEVKGDIVNITTLRRKIKCLLKTPVEKVPRYYYPKKNVREMLTKHSLVI